VTSAQLTSALPSCPPGQLVPLTSGTFNLSGGIKLPSNVTLRGQGMSTVLNFSACGGVGFQVDGGDVCVAIQGTWDSSGYRANVGYMGVPPSTVHGWTGTNGQSGVYTQGATVLNLDGPPTGLA